MNKEAIKYLSPIFIMLCLLLVSACGGNGDESGSTSTDNTTAAISLQPEISELNITRGTATGQWKANSTEHVAVQIGNTVKQYTVNEKRIMVSDAPFAWSDEALKDHAEKTIQAWYPYSASLSTNKAVSSNQSTTEGLDGSDFLYGTTQISYHLNDWIYPIKFYHQVAKLHITVTKSASDDNRTVNSVTINNVYLNGTFTAPSSDNLGTWATSGSTGNITAYSNSTTWDVLVIPQTIAAGTNFITINLGGEDIIYQQPSGSALNLASGKQYNFDFTIDKNDLRFAITVSSWTTGTSTDLPF